MWTLAQTCDFAERIKGRGDGGTMKKICCKGGDFRFDSGTYYLVMCCHGALRLFQGSTWLVDFSLKFDNTCKSDLVKILVLI